MEEGLGKTGMNSKDFLKEQQNLMIIQRMLYLILAFYLLLLHVLGMESNVARTTILVSVLFGVAFIEEIFFYFHYFGRKVILSVWRYLQYILVVIALYGSFEYPYATIALLGLLILYIVEFILAGDVSDKYSNILRIILLFSPFLLFVICVSGHFKDYKWLYVLFSYVILYGVIIRIMIFISHIIQMLQSELHTMKTTLGKTEDANHKLLDYQERIKTVNTELNLQKLDLERANDMIKAANAEISVQAEIARFISGSFDVTKIANTIIDDIVESKKVAFCAIYIDKGVYLNKNANCIVRAEDASLKRRLNRDLPEYYSHYKSKYADIIIDNEVTKEKYAFIGNKKIKSMIFRPLNINNTLYGIFMVGNAQTEFTKDNLSFYDAIIAQLNIAINNCKLYLQTQNMARKDGLTGINNRTYFTTLYNETVKKILSQKSPICVALFDIDKFKRVNDTYGHLAGDEVIKMVASTAEAHIDEYSGFVCRYGGEEFVAVLPGKNIQTAETIIKEMHKKIASSVVEYAGERIGINVSIGLTAYPEICDNPYDLLKRADWAMYFAKEHGRGQVKVDGDDVEPVS